MFNGIVEEMGTVQHILARENLYVVKIKAKKVLRGMKPGDSLAVDGVCLTVTAKRRGILTFDIMQETIRTTTWGCLKTGQKVNLERALTFHSRISGHFVTGHIDDTGWIQKKITKANYTQLQIGLRKKRLIQYIVPKGSVALDGVSLTVGTVNKDHFSVYLIPLTKRATTLGFKQKGDQVNIETDILAKYILNR